MRLMNKQWMILTLLLLSASLAESSYSKNLDVGPFMAKFNANFSEQPTINLTDPVKENGFDEYGFRLKTGILRNRAIEVVIDYYNNSTDVSETKLMDLITNMIESKSSYKADWDKVNISGIAGIRGKIRESETLKSYQISAFSPDGKDNKGNVVVFIRSSYPDDVTDSFLREFQIIRMR